MSQLPNNAGQLQFPTPYDTPTVPQTPAQILSGMVNQAMQINQRLFQQIVQSYMQQWSFVWANTTQAPLQVLTAFGTHAQLMFTTASAMANAVDTICAAKEIANPIPTVMLSAPQPVTFNPDGSIAKVGS